MTNQLKLPKKFEVMEMLDIIVSPTTNEIGILIMGEDLHSIVEKPSIRIYQLLLEDSHYVPTKELVAFSFLDLEAAMDFTENLPQMNALELLILMNNSHEAVNILN